MNKRQSSILVVDDHPVVRYGISRILGKETDFFVCGEAEDAYSALAAVRKLKPDIVLLDISLKDVDGLQLLRIIRSEFPSIRVLIVSMHEESLYAKKALRSGANGYIMKEESPEKLVAAVRHVLKGEVYASDSVKKNVLHAFTSKEESLSIVDKLSDRERQIFLMFGKGCTSKDVAAKLRLSVKTVETHRSRIKLKLGIATTPKLLLTASEWVRHEGLAPRFT